MLLLLILNFGFILLRGYTIAKWGFHIRCTKLLLSLIPSVSCSLERIFLVLIGALLSWNDRMALVGAHIWHLSELDVIGLALVIYGGIISHPFIQYLHSRSTYSHHWLLFYRSWFSLFVSTYDSLFGDLCSDRLCPNSFDRIEAAVALSVPAQSMWDRYRIAELCLSDTFK